MVTETRVRKGNQYTLTEVDSRRKELYNLTDEDGNYAMFKVIRELGIPSSRHGLFMGCIHLCDGNIEQAYETYEGIIKGEISIDAVIDSMIRVYVSGTGVALYECYESIVSSLYSTSREHVRDTIADALRDSLDDVPHVRDNTEPVQSISFRLPKKN